MKDYDRLIIATVIACLFSGWVVVEVLTWIVAHVTIGFTA